MKIETEIIKKLIKKENPIEVVGWKLLDLWKNIANHKNNISDYYYEGEKEIKFFEEFILNSYFEFYLLLAKHCLEKKVKLKESPEACFVVLDGFSMREGALLFRSLKDRGFKICYSFDLSAIPSDTEIFRNKLDMPFSEFKIINNPKNIKLPKDTKYIWSIFPDVMLDKIKIGHAVISSLEEMYKQTEEIIMDVISKINAKKIIILSDHGYIRTEAGFSFSVPDRAKKKLQKTLGGKRYIKIDSVEIKDLIKEGYVEEFNGYYLAKSLYSWPIPGKFSIYIHGGLSLMECFTPVLEIEKKD